MNTKKLFGLLACAVVFTAYGAEIDWFNGKVSTTTTDAISTPENATWTEGEGVTLGAGFIEIDKDLSDPLVLAPTQDSEPKLSDGVVTVSATAVLTPSAVDDLPTSDGLANAKAGFAVATDNSGSTYSYYGYTGSAWVKLAGVAIESANVDTASTSFKIVLDYRTGKKTVAFYVGDTQLSSASEPTVTTWSIDAEATSLTDVAAFGNGSITALAATCEQAVAAVTVGGVTTKYGSVTEALAAASAGDTSVQDVSADGTATSEAQAANGLYAWQCDALNIEKDAMIALKPGTQNEEKIILSAQVEPVDGVNVTFGVSCNGAAAVGNYAKDEIQIPLQTGTYTIVPIIEASAQ